MMTRITVRWMVTAFAVAVGPVAAAQQPLPAPQPAAQRPQPASQPAAQRPQPASQPVAQPAQPASQGARDSDVGFGDPSRPGTLQSECDQWKHHHQRHQSEGRGD